MNFFSFHKKLRLLKKEDFYFDRKSSSPIFTDSLILLYRKNNLENSRLGLSISKKIGKAYKRNIVKRAIREEFRTKHSSFKNKYDLHFIVSKKCNKSMDIEKIKSDIVLIFQRLSI